MNQPSDSEVLSELARWSWRNDWFNILDGYYRDKGWNDDRIRRRLRELEPRYLERGWARLPDPVHYYSPSRHVWRTLRIRP
jgi:hypothetical protein